MIWTRRLCRYQPLLQELKMKTIRQRVKVWQIHPAKLKKTEYRSFLIRANIDSDPKTFQPEEEVTEFKNKNEVAADTKEERINETEVEASASTSVETKSGT